MNIIKIDTTALLKNYSNYTLNNNDKNRIKGLLDLSILLLFPLILMFLIMMQGRIILLTKTGF